MNTSLLVPVQKWLFFPHSSLLSKFNHQDIVYMHPKGTSCTIEPVQEVLDCFMEC